MTLTPIPCQKDFFNIPDDITYLNCAYMSPVANSVLEAGFEGIRKKLKPWAIKPIDFFEDAEKLRTLFAKIIGASSDDVALIPSASYGIAIATANIKINTGEEILVLDEQFPSNYYPWLELTKTSGAVIKTVKQSASGDWTSAVLGAIAQNTKIVTIPNVHWTDGSFVDVKQISLKCKKVGAKLVLDVTQSLGALPLSVEEVKPDFLVCSAYKWLLGPYSLAYIYVAPEFQNGRPIEYNWLNRADSENFTGLVNYKDTYQPGARRFDMGERANFGLIPAAITALELILEWSVPNIRETIRKLTNSIAEQVSEFGLSVPPSKQRSAHIIGIRFPQTLPDGIADKLAAEKIFVSIRGNSIRVAPHVYNREEDVSGLISVLKNFVG